MKNQSEPWLAALSECSSESQRLAFGLACAMRIEHLLEDARAIECLAVLRGFVEGRTGWTELDAAAHQMAHVAQSHRGSASIDGCSHAAVSATYAVANALAGKAVAAADYAAYAAVYAYGGYAVTDPQAYEPERAWQRAAWQALSSSTSPHTQAAAP